MSNVPTPFLRTATLVVLAVWLALALTPFASGTEPALQIGYVRGRLVHLREIPPQESLSHDTVLLHLKPGDVFVTDGMRTGISYTGQGTGTWFHVRRLDDPSISGWIYERYLVLIPGAYLNTQESLDAIKAAHDAQSPAASATTIVQNNEVQHDVQKITVQPSYVPTWLERLRALFAPVVDFLSDVFSILDNIVNLLTLVVTFGIGRWLLNKFRPASVAMSPAFSPQQNAPFTAPPPQPRKPKHLYFDGFHVPNP